MPSLTPKENYLRCLRHEDYEYVPCAGMGIEDNFCGFTVPLDAAPTIGAEYIDCFGVRWVPSDSTSGTLIPAPGEFMLKDITQWKKIVKIPDLEKLNWEKYADEEKALLPIDRDKQAVIYYNTSGPWLRLAALMGFEETMIAMIEEPEACYEFFGAIIDYKIKLAEKIHKYFQADIFNSYDDFATERGLFISPETYRALLKPQHKRLIDAVRNLEMIPMQHLCGKGEICVEDYIETGTAGWNSVQPTNNLAEMLDKYGDKFCFEGGYDSTGKPGQPYASIDEVKAEVERCFREYGGKKGYIFSGFVLAETGNKDREAKNAAIMETANRLRFAGKQDNPLK
jgi:hypothetical protein